MRGKEGSIFQRMRWRKKREGGRKREKKGKERRKGNQ